MASWRTLSLASSKPTLPVHPRGDLRQQLPLGLGPLPLLPDLALGALGVAEVGEEEPLVAADQAGAVGAGEAGQVADVVEVGDEQLVELALGDQLGEPAPPCVIRPASRRSAPSASR